MEVNGEKKTREENEEKEVYYNNSLLNSPCSAFNKVVQAMFKCLCLDSSSYSSPSSLSKDEEQDPETNQIAEETGFMAMVTRLIRRPRPTYSSGQPGQIN
ncbi:unnamed protein product [Cochlearia groenlandica]